MQTRARSIIRLGYWLSTPVMTFRRFASLSLIRRPGADGGRALERRGGERRNKTLSSFSVGKIEED